MAIPSRDLVGSGMTGWGPGGFGSEAAFFIDLEIKPRLRTCIYMQTHAEFPQPTCFCQLGTLARSFVKSDQETFPQGRALLSQSPLDALEQSALQPSEDQQVIKSYQSSVPKKKAGKAQGTNQLLGVRARDVRNSSFR